MDVRGRGVQSRLVAGGTDGHTAVASLPGVLRGPEAGGGHGESWRGVPACAGLVADAGGQGSGRHWASGGGASTGCGVPPGGSLPGLGPSPRCLRATVWLAVLGHGGLGCREASCAVRRRPCWWPCVERTGSGTAFYGP